MKEIIIIAIIFAVILAIFFALILKKFKEYSDEQISKIKLENQELLKKIKEDNEKEDILKLEAPKQDVIDKRARELLGGDSVQLIDKAFIDKQRKWGYDFSFAIAEDIMRAWHRIDLAYEEGKLETRLNVLTIEYFASDQSKEYQEKRNDMQNGYVNLLVYSANDVNGFFELGWKTSKGHDIVRYYDPRFLLKEAIEDIKERHGKGYLLKDMIDNWNDSFESALTSSYKVKIFRKPTN